MEQLNKDKLILPFVILLASVILGGFYYASQLSNQKYIKEQQLIKLEAEKQKIEAKEEESIQNDKEVLKRLNSDNPEDAVRFVRELKIYNPAEADRIIESMTDEEYAKYDKAKSRL